MTNTLERPRMLSPYVGELDPELGLLVFEGHVRASDMRLALGMTKDARWKARLAIAGITPVVRPAIHRTLWLTAAEARWLLLTTEVAR